MDHLPVLEGGFMHQQSVRRAQVRHMLVTALVVLLAPLTTAAIAIGGVQLAAPLGAPLQDPGIRTVDEPATDEPASIAPHAHADQRRRTDRGPGRLLISR